MNKYAEKCLGCSIFIPPTEGVFIQSGNKSRIYHSACSPIKQKAQSIEPTKTFTLDPEIIQRLFVNRLIFFKILHKKLSIRTNWNTKLLYVITPEIFTQALDRFIDKYNSTDIDYEDAKKLLFRICDIQSLIFIEKKIDEDWWRGLSMEARRVGLKPPSYFYHKKYLEMNNERINRRRRENYKTNPKLKMQRKTRWENKKQKEISKKDPTVEQLRATWAKSTYVQALKVIHETNLQKN